MTFTKITTIIIKLRILEATDHYVTRTVFCDLFKKESTRKGKNLLIGEQSLFFGEFTLMRWEAKLKIKELLSLKVSPFTLIYQNYCILSGRAARATNRLRMRAFCFSHAQFSYLLRKVCSPRLSFIY